MPYPFCFCRITIIEEPPKEYKGFAGLWTHCVRCGGWIEVATEIDRPGNR